MWEKVFQTVIGRVAFALICFIGSGLFLFVAGVWENNVASPEYVNQRINEQTEEVRVMLSIEDQEIRKELMEAKAQNVTNQGQLIGKLDAVKKSFEDANQSRIIFQTQASSDLKYLKENVGEMKEVQKETIQRVRNLESGNKKN